MSIKGFILWIVVLVQYGVVQVIDKQLAIGVFQQISILCACAPPPDRLP